MKQEQAPPQALPEYKSNGGAGSVMTMIEGIITDAKNMETESIKDEQDAQAAYESFLAESFASIEAAQRAVTNKAEAMDTKEALAKTLAELHSGCDFVMDNFDARE